MSKVLLAPGAFAFAAVGLALAPAPAVAQSGTITEIEVFGNDPCPRSTDDEIVVCARKPESERFRIPEKLREGGSLQSRQSWAARAQSFETVGATGVNSCSAVGPGGYSGCLEQLIEDSFKERRERIKRDEVAPPE